MNYLLVLYFLRCVFPGDWSENIVQCFQREK